MARDVSPIQRLLEGQGLLQCREHPREQFPGVFPGGLKPEGEQKQGGRRGPGKPDPQPNLRQSHHALGGAHHDGIHPHRVQLLPGGGGQAAQSQSAAPVAGRARFHHGHAGAMEKGGDDPIPEEMAQPILSTLPLPAVFKRHHRHGECPGLGGQGRRGEDRHGAEKREKHQRGECRTPPRPSAEPPRKEHRRPGERAMGEPPRQSFWKPCHSSLRQSALGAFNFGGKNFGGPLHRRLRCCLRCRLRCRLR